MSPARILLLAALIAIGSPPGTATAADAAAAGDPDTQATPSPASGGAPTTPGYQRVLPFLADEAIKSGHELPLPFGSAVILTGLFDRRIDVSDVRVGLNSPVQSVSQFLQLGSTSNVLNANLKFDAWLLPFLNVYALVGGVYNRSTTHALITVPKPGPIPGTLQFDKDVTTELNGVVAGGGMTLAGGYQSFFMVADVSYVQSDLGFDNAFKAFIATIRAGWNGRFGELPVQLWAGVGDWDTAATATGHVDLEGVGRLDFEADQHPHTPWMYDVGTNLEFSKKFQLVVDFGFDLQGGYLVVVGPTLRF